MFEQMHRVCFHYEFEHGPFDPDEECEAGDCPSAAIRPTTRPATREPPARLALTCANAPVLGVTDLHLGGTQEWQCRQCE